MRHDLRTLGSALPPHSGPWTPPAYDVSMGREEEQAKRRQVRKKKEEEAAKEEEEEVEVLLAVPMQLRTPTQWARLRELIGASSQSRRRKRKKRRKRRLPRTSSLSLPRRRLRQWHMQGWFCWFLSYAVSPSFGGRPKLPRFMDGMDKMDSFIARRRSRQWPAGFAGIVPRAVFSFPGRQAPMLLGIHGRYGPRRTVMRFFLARLVLLVIRCTSRCVLFPGSQAPDARHHGRYESEGQLPEAYRQLDFFGR